MAKIIKYIYYILGIGLILFLIFSNIDYFITTTNRFKEIFNINELETFFDIFIKDNNNLLEDSMDKVEDVFDTVIGGVTNPETIPFKDIFLNILSNLLIFIYNFIIYFCNFGLNVILIFYFFLKDKFNGTQTKIKTTAPAKLYIKFTQLVDNTINKIKQSIIKLLQFLHSKRRNIALQLLLLLLASGVLYYIITEVLIFMTVYIVKTFNLETYLVLQSLLKSLAIVFFKNYDKIPTFILVPLIFVCVFLKAYFSAKKKLLENHNKMKRFVGEDLTQTTFINGSPGTGKTLLNVSMTLAAEENYIDELERILLDYELNHKNINFAQVRDNPSIYPEHKDYITTHNFLNNRDSFVISNYAIYTPLYEDYSKIFNFDYMRVNKPTEDYPLEEYTVISLSEFDKEYNSHDDKKAVGEDGAATFFSTVSHDQKRHIKLFVDYQLKDQVPLRIRGNAEYFLTVKKRKKKYPLLLMIYFAPFLLLNKLVKKLIKKYELKKKYVSKKSTRKRKADYKRNDISLPYIILRHLAYVLTFINKFFEQFYYFKLYVHLFQEGDFGKPKKKTLSINIRDLKHNDHPLYDSTFLSFIYEQKKNKQFKDLDKFTQLAPSKEELEKCKSRFYEKINH